MSNHMVGWGDAHEDNLVKFGNKQPAGLSSRFLLVNHPL